LYLGRAESRLAAEVPGARLFRQLWLLGELLAEIDRTVSPKVTELDAAGQELGELESISTALARLAQRRRKLLIAVANKYGLDVRLLIAGDTIEMERLNVVLQSAEPPAPSADDSEEPPDDPIAEVLRGKQLLALYRRLAMTKHYVSYDSLEDLDCWNALPHDGTIQRGLRKLQTELSHIGGGVTLEIRHAERRAKICR
jgi:hypothetical protein